MLTQAAVRRYAVGQQIDEEVADQEFDPARLADEGERG